MKSLKKRREKKEMLIKTKNNFWNSKEDSESEGEQDETISMSSLESENQQESLSSEEEAELQKRREQQDKILKHELTEKEKKKMSLKMSMLKHTAGIKERVVTLCTHENSFLKLKRMQNLDKAIKVCKHDKKRQQD